MPREQNEESSALIAKLRESNKTYFLDNEHFLRHVYEDQFLLIYTNSQGGKVICAAPEGGILKKTLSLLGKIQRHSAYLAFPKKSR